MTLRDRLTYEPLARTLLMIARMQRGGIQFRGAAADRVREILARKR